MEDISKKRKILIFDDSEADIFLITNIINKASNNFEVTGCLTFSEAKTALEQHNFCCVVIDFLLEDMSGFDFIKTARSYNPEAKIIFTSGYGNELIAQDAITTGATTYFSKDDINSENFKNFFRTL